MKSASRIARDVCGREDVLRAELRAIGAKVIREYPGPNRPELAQIQVRLPDGTMGYFSPGGPRAMPDYVFIVGNRPGDETIEGVDP